MDTKYDAIEHFAFMKKIYDKVPHSGFTTNTGEEIDLRGVFFYKEYAYSTNRHIIGRLKINDNLPVMKPMFWKYSDEEYENVAGKFLLDFKNYCRPDEGFDSIFNERFANNIELFFNQSTQTCFFFRRDTLLTLLDKLYGEKEVAKIKTNVSISITPEYEVFLDFQPVKPTPKNQPAQKTIPLFTHPSRTQNIKVITQECIVNVFYLHSILRYSFKSGQIVGMKYSKERRVPVTLFNKQHDIFWAIAQKI